MVKTEYQQYAVLNRPAADLSLSAQLRSLGNLVTQYTIAPRAQTPVPAKFVAATATDRTPHFTMPVSEKHRSRPLAISGLTAWVCADEFATPEIGQHRAQTPLQTNHDVFEHELPPIASSSPLIDTGKDRRLLSSPETDASAHRAVAAQSRGQPEMCCLADHKADLHVKSVWLYAHIAIRLPERHQKARCYR